MTTGIAAGLGATLGWGVEGTVGTYAAPTVWQPFEKESLKFKKTETQGKELYGGLYMLASSRQLVTHTAEGTIDLNLRDRGYGKLFHQMLGGTAPTPTEIGSTGAYTAVFTPGDTTGQSLSIQVGKPETTGTIVPYSYNGAKITDWTLNVAVNEIATLELSIDAWNEVTSQSYTAPSLVASDILTFVGATLLIGGTASTTSGVCSVSGATSFAVAKSCQIKGANPLEIDRFFLGSSGTKAEQIANNFRTISGQIAAEFDSTSDLYATFVADTPVALQLNFVGPTIGSGTQSAVQVLIPRIYWEGDSPTVDGPGVLQITAPFTGLYDGVNAPIQVTTVSLDSTV